MKSLKFIASVLLLAACPPLAWAQGSGSGAGSGSGSGSGGGSGSGVGGTGLDSAVQSSGEASSKTSGGLGRGLEAAFGGLTILDGLGVGDVVAMDFVLLGDPGDDGYLIRTLADTGEPVIVRVRGTRIASIERSAAVLPIFPPAHACS